MPSYISDDYLVADGVIVLYTGKQVERIVIPGIIGNQKITQIGSGAFRNCLLLKSITIPDGVTKINSNAFLGCLKLEEIALPLFSNQLIIEDGAFAGCEKIQRILATMSGVDFEQLDIMGHKLDDGTVVILDNPIIKKVICSKSAYIKKIPAESKYIFATKDEKMTTVKAGLTVYGLKDVLVMEEDEAVMRYLANNNEKELSSDDESVMDWHARANKPISYNTTSLAYFYPDEIMHRGPNVYLKFYIADGYHFVQSAVRIVYERQEFYVYRRFYLSSEEKEPLVRREIAIYSKNGIVNNPDLTREIYAKYMLLALL